MRRAMPLATAVILVLAGLLLAGPSDARGQGSLEANKDVLRQLYDAYNAGNWAALDTMIAADAVDHDATPGQAPGRAGVIQQLMGFRAAFKGDVVIDDLVAEGDLVADRVHLDGTQTGAFFGVPATGKPVHIEANEIWRITDGKIVEGWHVENLLQVLIQLGAVPSPNGPAATPMAATPGMPMPMPTSSPPAASPVATGDLTANKDLVRRYYAAVNAGNLAAFDDLIAPDAIDHDPALRNQEPGRAGIRKEIAALLTAFPDYHITNEQLIAEGDMVVVRSLAHGTQRGPLSGIPPTGKPVTFEAIDFWRVQNGQIVEVWHVEQLLSVLIQVGAIPAPGAAPAAPAATPMS